MPNSTNTAPDHVVFDFQRGEMACRHCGAAQPVAMPISVTVLVEQTNAFLSLHELCTVPSPADDGEAAFLDAAAKDCHSCPCCQQVPCDACQAAGVCDAFECRHESDDRAPDSNDVDDAEECA